MESTDFSVVRAHIKSRSLCSLLVCTQKKYEVDGSLSPYGHCSLVSPIVLRGDDFLYLGSDCKSGSYLSEAQIAQLDPIFLLLLP